MDTTTSNIQTSVDDALHDLQHTPWEAPLLFEVDHVEDKFGNGVALPEGNKVDILQYTKSKYRNGKVYFQKDKYDPSNGFETVAEVGDVGWAKLKTDLERAA